MTDETANTAQTDTDAGNGNESATEASQDTNQTVETGGEGGDTGSQSAAEAEGNDGGAETASDQEETSDENEDEAEGEGYIGAPESYDEFNLPEGVPIDEKALELSQDTFRKLNLSQKGAQEFVDLYAELQALQVDGIIAHHQQQQQDWVKEIKADKELGGTNFERSMAIARQAVDKFGDDEFKALLEPFDLENNPEGLGLANHPAFARVWHRIGMAISEDHPGPGGPNSQSEELSDEEWVKEAFDSAKSK